MLLVRLHLDGFFWGDVSLSNTLFRRDAGAYSAYLGSTPGPAVRPTLSVGQREHDLEVARVNIAGELMDLQAGGFLDESADAVEISEQLCARYRSLPGASHRQ